MKPWQIIISIYFGLNFLYPCNLFQNNFVLLIERKKSIFVLMKQKATYQTQKAIYERLAPRMLWLCRRYISDVHFAEDVMVTAFCKAFEKMNSLKDKDALDGWIRRIMVNECLNFIHSKQNILYAEQEVIDTDYAVLPEIQLQYEQEDLLQLIDALPKGYRLVFNLYAIEGYGHKEIAEMLDISISTSKTQLMRARNWLKEHLSNYQKINPCKTESTP